MGTEGKPLPFCSEHPAYKEMEARGMTVKGIRSIRIELDAFEIPTLVYTVVDSGDLEQWIGKLIDSGVKVVVVRKMLPE